MQSGPRSPIAQSKTRWAVCLLLFLATVISYINRQTVAIVAPMLAQEFRLSNEQIGHILSAFLLTYTFGQLVAGSLFDKIGSRLGFALSIGVWSLASLFTGAANSLASLVGLRLLLGVGESGNFPGGVKVIAEWFPPRDRAFAGGLFASGASVGAMVTGPLVGMIAHSFGWRAAFAVSGALGFVWLAAWLLFYRSPQPSAAAPENTRIAWIDLLRFRQVWSLAIARFFEEPVLWFGVFWLPKYAVDVQHLSILQTGWLLIAPFLALDAGYVLGGWISSRLLRSGWTVARSRLTVMAAAGLLMTSAIFAAQARTALAFFALISITMFGHGAWFTNVMTLATDVAPAPLVGSVYGIAALGGGLGGMIFTEGTGIVVDRFHSYSPVFIAAGLIPVAATVMLMAIGGGMKEIRDARTAARSSLFE